MTSSNSYPSGFPQADNLTVVEWLKKNLFNTWYNSLLTLVILGLILWSGFGFITWATTAAKWDVIPANLPLFFVGRFPVDQYWRLWLMLGMISFLSGIT